MKNNFTIKLNTIASWILAGFLFSCTTQNLGEVHPIFENDDLLIEAIANARNKATISRSALPKNAITVLDNDYTDMMARTTYQVQKLGYEVNMVGVDPTTLGDFDATYFATDGRELIPSEDRMGYDPKGEGGKRYRSRIYFELVYPVSFTMPDGSTITVDSKQDFRDQIKSWYEANPNAEGKPRIVYPVDVILEAGEVMTINSEEEMRQLKKELREKNRRKLFELVYPISFTMPDDTTITANDKLEMLSLIKAWYEANPDSEGRPELVYPVSIRIIETDEIVTFDSKEEMQEFIKSIREQSQHSRLVALVYPVRFTMPDESIITAESKEDQRERIKAWYEANPDSKEPPKLIFPVDVKILETEEIVTVNSRDELIELIKSLRDRD